MKAVVVHVYGPPESLRYDDFPDPAPPGPNEVLIRIAAASVNPADARLASGEHAELWPLSSLPRASGRDLAGVVEAVGPGVTDFASAIRFTAIPASIGRAPGQTRSSCPPSGSRLRQNRFR